MSSGCKVALVSTKLGCVERGFESFTRGLFDTLRDSLDLTLFKAAGKAAPDEVVVPSLWEHAGLLERVPLSPARRRRASERSFATGMLPHLFRNRYDIVHFSEYDLGDMLRRYRRLFGFRYRLLFSNGAPAPPSLCAGFDFTQQVNQVRLDEAVAAGLPANRLRLVPYGIDANRFAPVGPERRRTLREKHGIPADRIVVACAAALKRHHKRIDHLVEEFSGLRPADFFLVVAGHRTDETPGLVALADQRLGSNYRFLTLPHESMHELYQMADIFVLPSLTEGLPIVVLEAMAAALPVLVHHDPLYAWAVADPRATIDMAEPGELRLAIARLADDAAERHDRGQSLMRNARVRFDWRILEADYISLYDDVLRASAVPANAATGQGGHALRDTRERHAAHAASTGRTL